MEEKYKELWNEIFHYGLVVADTGVETYNLDIVRVRVFNLNDKLYWVTQFNGEVTNIQEIGKA